ncbi:MAG: 4Fe-4S dicluster domain-containing protein [Deltaproteobacteria bacterium]|nr:4Fe-4S dicluster domain-containing protein [Deltaproteobacteria bacterium]
MPASWGLFLCNCRKTLPLDPEKLILPTAPSVLTAASEPKSQAPEFAARIERERPDRVLVSCCAEQKLFDEALAGSGPQPPKVQFLNLRESCFLPHLDDPDRAHAKATRLLRATMESVETNETPVYNSLKVGANVVIAGEGLKAKDLATKLRDTIRPILVFPASQATADKAGSGQAYTGKVVEVHGRLGDFHVTIEDGGNGEKNRQELKAAQVVVISPDGSFPCKPRTGCHLLAHSGEADLDRVAERIHELTGDFLKPVQVTYNTEVCAGGSAEQEACGVCITACPYEAISRDPENHLRMKVDHMACEGCGACVSACPTSALRFTEPSPQDLYARLAALLAPSSGKSDGEAWTILFHCGEQGKRALEAAGRKPIPYAATVLPVEVPCLRYVSEANMLEAFRLGAAGVALLGCESCQHGERELLYQKSDLSRLVLDAFALGSERLRLFTADTGMEAEAIGALSSFANALKPAPIRWDGRPMREQGNREVIAGAIATFIEQTGREAGQRSLEPSQPFAFADVEESGCTMCRSCVNVCPVHAFRLEESASSLQFKHISCIGCGLCETVCPEKVISLKRAIYLERDALDYQTVAQDSMVSCLQCGKPYINRKALEAVEARVLSLGSLLDTFSGSRRGLLRMCPNCRAVAAMLEVDKGWKP